MVQGKVEICGVNTAKLPLLKAADKEALFAKIREGDTRRQRDLHRRQPASGPERDQTLFRQCGKCGRSVPDRLYRTDQIH